MKATSSKNINSLPYPDLFGTSARVQFLNSLRSQGKYKYARYRGLPLRYAGGKSLGVGHVVEQFRDGLKRLVSPFRGAVLLILEVQWQYTLGQGETRIGKNRIENGTRHIKQSHELLIVKES